MLQWIEDQGLQRVFYPLFAFIPLLDLIFVFSLLWLGWSHQKYGLKMKFNVFEIKGVSFHSFVYPSEIEANYVFD